MEEHTYPENVLQGKARSGSQREEDILLLALLDMLILLPKALKRFSITLGIKFIVPAKASRPQHSLALMHAHPSVPYLKTFAVPLPLHVPHVILVSHVTFLHIFSVR